MNVARAAIVVAILGTRVVAAPSAETLYAQGQDAYDHAAYAVAIAKWTESYALSGAPGLLFNVAQAQRLNGDCVSALASYERFVAADPKSEQRPLADDFIRELGSTCGAATQKSPVDRPSTKPGRTLRVLGLATGGAGLAMLVTEIALGHHGHVLGDEITAACRTSCEWAAQKARDATGRRDVAVGYALDAVGAAAIAAGAVIYYFGVRDHGVSLAPRSSEPGVVLTWSGVW